MGPSVGVAPTATILRSSTVQTMVDAARHVCRAWFTSEPMGGAMSDLADQLARIDKGQTHGQADSTRGNGWTAPEGQGHEAIDLRGGCPVQADGEAA